MSAANARHRAARKRDAAWDQSTISADETARCIGSRLH
jgi:hypothetical protein